VKFQCTTALRKLDAILILLSHGKTSVYITVDVETSMGGAWRYPERRPLPVEKRIFCETAGPALGIPLLVDELTRYGFRATFFVEVFLAECLGKPANQRVFDYLLKQGQDVQLHTHPTFRNYARAQQEGTPEAFARYSKMPDSINEYSFAQQCALLDEACELFHSLGGFRPAAYRAGGYRADRQTLQALKRAGITVDSSYNPNEPGSFPGDGPLPNVAQEIEGILELPVTTALSGAGRFRGWRSLEISAISLAEMKSALLQAHASGLEQVVMVFHSFSTVKPRDIFYSEFRPDRIVIGRYRGLLRFLAKNADKFTLSGMGDAARQPFRPLQANPPTLELGAFVPLMRKGVQALNRLYWV
jgi:hypothetical protein